MILRKDSSLTKIWVFWSNDASGFGQGDFEHNENKSWVKCKNCGREYPDGIDELATFNQNQIQDAADEVGEQLR